MSSLESKDLKDRPTRKPHILASIARQTNKRRVIVVEADDDKAVYEAILDRVLGMANFILYSPIDLGGNVDGKTGVLRIHDEMLKMVQDQQGLEKVYFILDKDVDDILGRLNPSPRIAYTTGYNIESDLFTACELSRVTAACLLKPLSTINSLDLDSAACRQRINSRWKEWIITCIFVRMHLNDDAPKSYSLKSKIHNGDGNLNLNKLAVWKNLLHSKSGLSKETIEAIWAYLDRAVSQWLVLDKGHKIVNGKWYPALLSLELNAVGFLKSSECSDLKSMWSVIISSLSPQSELVIAYRAKLGIT